MPVKVKEGVASPAIDGGRDETDAEGPASQDNFILANAGERSVFRREFSRRAREDMR